MTKKEFLNMNQIREMAKGYILTDEQYKYLKDNTCLTANSIGGFCDDSMVVLEAIADKINVNEVMCASIIEKAGLLDMENYKTTFNIVISDNESVVKDTLSIKSLDNEYVTSNFIYEDHDIKIAVIKRHTNDDTGKWIGVFKNDIVFIISKDKKDIYVKANDCNQSNQSSNDFNMMYKYNLGDKFLTAYDLEFKGFLIPKNTLFEIIEKIDDKNYKIYFKKTDDENHEECIQIMDISEISDMKISA